MEEQNEARPDQTGFELQLRQCQRLVFRIAFGVLRDAADAEEVTQDVFLQAYRKLSSLREAGKFRAWVARMSWRLALNRQRAADRARRRDTSWWQGANPGPENAEQRQEQLRAAQSAMPMPRVSWEKIIEHIDHIAKLAGAEHVGLGSDFDGATMPDGMEDCTKLPKITEALLQKGYSEQDVKNILGENLLRVMEKAEHVGRELRAAELGKKSF